MALLPPRHCREALSCAVYPSLTNTSTDITITFSQIKKLRLKGMNEFSQGTQLLREKAKNQYQVFYIKAMMKERKAEQKEKEGRK